MARRRRKPRPHRVVINNGHNTAEMVRDSDPNTGTPVVHAVNRTQLMMDQLLQDRLINRHHWQAANDIRALWLRARPVAEVMALDPSKIGHSASQSDIDPKADLELRKIVRALGKPLWTVIERLVYDNIDPRTWRGRPKYDGMVVTRVALSALSDEMGMS